MLPGNTNGKFAPGALPALAATTVPAGALPAALLNDQRFVSPASNDGVASPEASKQQVATASDLAEELGWVMGSFFEKMIRGSSNSEFPLKNPTSVSTCPRTGGIFKSAIPRKGR